MGFNVVVGPPDVVRIRASPDIELPSASDTFYWKINMEISFEINKYVLMNLYNVYTGLYQLRLRRVFTKCCGKWVSAEIQLKG